jgi:hypothetical protein
MDERKLTLFFQSFRNMYYIKLIKTINYVVLI